MKKWIKIGSKGSTYLARCNAAYKAINDRMRSISGISDLLSNYKYIEHTHYGSTAYPDELKKLYKQIHKKLGGVDGYIKLRKREYLKYLKGMEDVAAKINDKIPNDKLAGLFLKADDLYAQANSFLGLGTLYTDYLSRKLEEKFGNKYLTFDFSSKTKLSRYHQELIQLSKTKNKQEFVKKINKILKKYYWIGSFFFIGRELDKKQIYETIRNIKEQKIDERKKTLPPNPFVKEMKMLSKDRNEELEDFMLGEYYFKKLLQEIAKKIKIDFEALTYLSPYEIVGCLKGDKIPRLNINQRKKLFGFVIINGKVKEYWGQKAEFLKEKTPQNLNLIRGFVAYSTSTKVRGRVKIVSNTSDISEVNKGDILVTIMTAPNYIQAIYNAAAIITDEGGITCHASIISREMKKPCVIGTKIATKVLKDGDLVEVDANKGIVRKL